MRMNERLPRIVTRVDAKGFVTVKELSDWLDVSEVTIRRDLQRLHEEHRLKRTYGGAASLAPSPEPKASAREAEGDLSADANFLMDRVDVVINTAVGTYSDQLLLDRAEQRQIPVVTESLFQPGARTLVAVDNYEASRALGRWAGVYSLEHFEGRAEILDITYSMANTQERSQGFVEGVQEVNPQARVALSINGQSRYQTAYQLTKDALTVHPEINVIFAINDRMAAGAYQACLDLQIDPDELLILPFGLEGETFRSALAEGKYCKAGLAMFPEIVGPVCVEAAVQAWRGTPLPEHLVTPHAVLTTETLTDFYGWDGESWRIRWPAVLEGLQVPLEIDFEAPARAKEVPSRVGFVIRFSEHEWYQNMVRCVEAYAEARGIEVEVADSEQNFKDEIARRQRAIARHAASEVREGDVILIDSAPITGYLAEALKDRRNVTVITNSISVFETLRGNPELTLILTGGQFDPETEALVGPTAEASLGELRADKLFLAVTGITLDFGLSHTHLDNIAVKQAMIHGAREIILLADHTKFGEESTRQIAPAGAVDKLITDDALPASARLELTKLGVEVLIA